jgi:hypothetical protein
MVAPIAFAALLLQGFSTAQGQKGSRLDEKISRNISAFNARLASRDAELALRSSRERAEDIREDTDNLISRHRAAFGVSNVVTTSGSPLLAQLEQRVEGEKAAQSAILEGKVAAAGFSVRESLANFESQVTQKRGKVQRQQMLLSGTAKGSQSFFRLQ